MNERQRSQIPVRTKDGWVAARIDPADLPVVAGYAWRLSSYGYAVRSETWPGGHRGVFMHVEIARPPDGMQVDHINLDKLDNRRANLRVVTPAQNAQNLPAWSATGYRNVYRTKNGRYMVQFSKPYAYHGVYATPEEAADVAARVRAERLPYAVPGR